jgi:hypothetical protein
LPHRRRHKLPQGHSSAAKAPPSFAPFPASLEANSSRGINDEKVSGCSSSDCGVRLAEEFYIGYDGKRCEMFSHKPGDKMNLIGTFNSKHDAEKAMKEMKQCNKG